MVLKDSLEMLDEETYIHFGNILFASIGDAVIVTQEGKQRIMRIGVASRFRRDGGLQFISSDVVYRHIALRSEYTDY